MSTFPIVTLSDGTKVPGIAYGAGTAWYNAGAGQISRPLVDAVKLAIKTGFTHIDGAEMYNNEESVGLGIKESGVPREELFITTKVFTGLNDIRGTFLSQLKKIGVSYVDLYLIHSPLNFGTPGYPTYEEAWKELEKLKDEGLIKSLGVSNFAVSDIQKILAVAKHRPTVNQIEFHPYLYKETERLYNFLKEEKIAIAAYAPSLPVTHATGGPIDPVLEKVAAAASEREGKKVEPGQVLLKLASEMGAIVVTTTSKEFRMKEQLAAGAIMLTDAEIAELKEAGDKLAKRNYMPHMSGRA
ncbi:NADP-dependent D-sorbitol-6-phosphate dehydrogenase [Meredithblackwellia eburnea MCA 4105]